MTVSGFTVLAVPYFFHAGQSSTKGVWPDLMFIVAIPATSPTIYEGLGFRDNGGNHARRHGATKIDQPLREPYQIRKHYAWTLGVVETGAMFSSILGCRLGED